MTRPPRAPRRLVRVATCALVAAFSTLLVVGACSDATVTPRTPSDANGGQWATWVLANGSALRPAAPPAVGSPEAARELEEIVTLQRARSADLDARIRRWDASVTAPWTMTATDLLAFYWAILPDVRTATPARSARAMALLHVAMYDALVATWDAKYAFARRAPAASDARVQWLGRRSDLPSSPSEHAAAAAAAAAGLSYVFPAEDAARFSALARQAGESRIAAGAAYRSDVEAGLALGGAVGRSVVARAKGDGSDAAWTGAVPTGAALWVPTPPRRVQTPFDPLAGQWKTWVIASGRTFRPDPPPAPGPPAFMASLTELRQLSTGRTTTQADAARYWATEAPSIRWEFFMLEEIARRGLTPLRAARAQALASVAMADAFAVCWDAKFHYWLARPVTMDPAIATVFSTPPFPSYPSGHSTISAAAAELFAVLFPDAADRYRAKAHEASESRVWAGVHYRFDIDAGEALGRKVGLAVVDRARKDGASP
ncbi:MAG: hypothetical protein NVS1B4_17960 [Gemmatimonadaceae bacterium]